MPRTPIVSAGVSLVHHAGVEDDRAVGAALVGLEPVERVVAADLLLALDEHAHVHRQLAGAAPGRQATCSSGRKLPLSSEAPRA